MLSGWSVRMIRLAGAAGAAAVALALITFWLHRRLVRATRLSRPWSWIVDGVLVILWALAVIGAASGSYLDPSWARAPARRKCGGTVVS